MYPSVRPQGFLAEGCGYARVQDRDVVIVLVCVCVYIYIYIK